MKTPDACPEPAQLRSMLAGNLDEAEESSVVEHLDRCPGCRAMLDRWAASADPLAGWSARITAPPSPALERILEGLKAIHPGGVEEDEGPAPTAFDGSTTAVGSPFDSGRVGPYELIDRIGRGGMGVVFKAIDPSLNRVVAVKVLAPELAASSLARRRFTREARAAAAVCHDHVVTIHAVGESEGLPYLVMQYVSGQSLQEKIDRGGRLGLGETLRIGMQVASGLAAAHAQGLVHRDIKPANILLENGIERAKITDFGLVVAASDARLTRDGSIAGTPQFMAPEVARGERVDPRTDLFSLGSVLYAMATGEAPFGGDNTMAVLRRVSDDPPRPIRELNPDVPTWLVEVIGRLMAKEPSSRYQTAREVAELLSLRLSELQGGGLPTIELIPKGPRFDGPKNVRRWVAALSAIVLISLLALALRSGSALDPRRKSGAASSVPGPSATSTPPGPQQRKDWLKLGEEAFRRGETAPAIEHLSTALKVDPGDVRAWIERGKVFAALADWPRVLADSNEAIRLDPRNSNAYELRGYAKLRSGDSPGTVLDCDEAIRLDPSNAFAHSHRGVAYNNLSQWDRAIADLDQMIGTIPKEPWSHFHRAHALQHRAELDRALADSDLAISLGPENPHFHRQRAQILAEMKDYERAVVAADESVRLAPEDPSFLIDRGQILVLKGDRSQALADYDRVIAAGRFDVGTFEARARVRESLGDLEGARVDRKSATRLRQGAAP